MSEQLYSIQVFDDGRSEYKDYPNVWRVTEQKFNGGKLALQNVSEPEVKIGSISSWKVRIIENNAPAKDPKLSEKKKAVISGNESESSELTSDDYSSEEVLIIPEAAPRTLFESEEDIASYLKTPEGKAAYGNSETRALPE